jgi:hypothetical protein
MLEGREVQAHFSGFLGAYQPSKISVKFDGQIIGVWFGISGLYIQMTPAKARELAEGLIRELNRMELEKEMRP